MREARVLSEDGVRSSNGQMDMKTHRWNGKDQYSNGLFVVSIGVILDMAASNGMSCT
jgi:hypothetical protein